MANATLRRGTAAGLATNPGIRWEQCPPPRKPEKGAKYSTGQRVRPSKFEEAAFRTVLAEFCGTLTRASE
jgi:hypothetical protein